ncbi:MAG TPA: hypothetical protein VH369_11040 [Bryobacteraceae bacterium]
MASVMRVGSLIGGIIMLVLFAGGVATGIGLLYLRLWARLSILVFSGALIIIFGFSAVTIWLTPFPQAGAPPAVAAGMKAGVSVFYGVFALLGACWLYFFNRKTIKQQFKSPDPGALTVKVIAGFFLLSAAIMLVIAILPFPANFLGLVVAGTPGHFLNAAFGTIALATAIGLLRLKSWARPVAIAFCAFYGLSGILFIVLPGYSQRLSAWLELLPPGLRTEQNANPSSQMVIMLLMSTLIYAIPIWFLVRRRAVFTNAPPANTQSEPS